MTNEQFHKEKIKVTRMAIASAQTRLAMYQKRVDSKYNVDLNKASVEDAKRTISQLESELNRLKSEQS